MYHVSYNFIGSGVFSFLRRKTSAIQRVDPPTQIVRESQLNLIPSGKQT